MSLSQATIEAVRGVAITSILESEGIQFKRVGREAVALCPWHKDTNPSLTINDSKGLCFCFACGGGKDGIDFVRQKFGISFSEAVERIADKHSIEVLRDDADEAAQRKRRARIGVKRDSLTRAQERYRRNIRSTLGAGARDWVLSRGLTAEASQHFELGWDPGAPDGGRLTIPIHDHMGKIVGFSKRVIDPLYSGKQKYINSEDSEIFSKSSLFFNEHRAATAARDSGFMVIVEGQLDVAALWCAGHLNVVAIQGTAIPAEAAARRLMLKCSNLVLCMDADKGGTSSTARALSVLGPFACRGEVNISIARLPEGSDPASYVQSGADFGSIVEAAVPWLDWQIDSWLAGLDRADVKGFSAAEAATRELVGSIRSPALRQYYVDKASSVLASTPEAASALAKGWMSGLPAISHRAAWTKPDPQWVRHQVERRALRLYVHYPALREALRPLMGFLAGAAHVWFWRRVVELEKLSPSFGPREAMAILVVSEQRYSRVVRPLVQPTISLSADPGAVEYVRSKLVDLGGSLL
jgi:DNA primase